MLPVYTHTPGRMKQGHADLPTDCEENHQWQYVCSYCMLHNNYIILFQWGMAEFCSSWSVVDTVRHHAKVLSQFCFNDWMSASLSLMLLYRDEYNNTPWKWRCCSVSIHVGFCIDFFFFFFFPQFASFMQADQCMFLKQEHENNGQLLHSW